jgi:hypothetical protein
MFTYSEHLPAILTLRIPWLSKYKEDKFRRRDIIAIYKLVE